MSPRTKLLIGVVLLLIVAKLGWSWYANWGLITINVDGKPLADVVQSIEKQGHVDLRTNFSAPVTMHVDRVPVAEALETLAAVTDARWELAYVGAPEQATALNYLDQLTKGERPADWTSIHESTPNFSDDAEEVAIDPRADRWEVKPPKEANLQGYLKEAAKSVDASFRYPKDWNPAVGQAPATGEIRKVAPKLFKLAGGTVVETFLLIRHEQRTADGERPERPDWSDRGGEDRPRFDPAAMQERVEAEIAKLPVAEQPAAREKAAKRREFFTSLRDLPEEERRAKIMELMSDPAVQSRMDDRTADRERRQTPDQRHDRYQRYTQRKAAAQNRP